MEQEKKKSYMITEHNITANRRDGKKEKRAGKGLSKQSLTLQRSLIYFRQLSVILFTESQTGASLFAIMRTVHF